MRNVTGQKDESMRLLRALRTESGRIEQGTYFVEGVEMLRRAFLYGAEVREVILEKHFAAGPEGQVVFALLRESGTKVSCATAGLLSWAVGAKPTPSCVCIVTRRTVSMDDILGRKRGLVALVEHGESADNLGMFLRTAEAAGVTGVILAADTVDPFNRRTARGSRGATFNLDICIYKDAVLAVKAAAQAGLATIGTSAVTDVLYTDADLTGPIMIVIGNEHTGMTDEVKESVDQVVRIPMAGEIHSLNIAVAGSILLYEAVRQRG